MQTLNFSIRNICGKTYYYPENNAAQAIVLLTRYKRSLTPEHIDILRALGLNILIVNPKEILQ